MTLRIEKAFGLINYVGTNYNRVSGLKLLSYEPSERKDHAKLCLFIKEIYLIIE